MFSILAIWSIQYRAKVHVGGIGGCNAPDWQSIDQWIVHGSVQVERPYLQALRVGSKGKRSPHGRVQRDRLAAFNRRTVDLHDHGLWGVGERGHLPDESSNSDMFVWS